jgi:hypothetical protein
MRRTRTNVRRLPGHAYKYAPGLHAIDAVADKAPAFDTGKMSATGVLATTMRDREGDILEVAGIRTANHQLNPIVLLDHGLYFPLPIGKTADPDGNYAVAIDPDLGECVQTTYFSQSLREAEQVFHLIVEGILRANSIGYRTLKGKRLPPDPATGTKPGVHILECELIEATWCGIPCNPDAVRAALSRDRICGKSITPAVKRLLLPHAPPAPVWSPGATLPTTQSPAGKDNPGRETAMSKKTATKTDDLDTQTASVPPQAPAEAPTDTPAEEPFGAEVLRCLHADLSAAVDRCTTALKRVDNDKVKSSILDLTDDLDAAVETVEKAFADAYPDLDPIAAEAADDTDANEEPADEKARSGKSAKPAPKAPAVERKRLTKSLHSMVKDAADFLAEHQESESLTRQEKAAVAYHARALDEIARSNDSVTDEDELTAEDRKALATLERQIARRERLLARLNAR